MTTTTDPAAVVALTPCPTWCTLRGLGEGPADPHEHHVGHVSWNLNLCADTGGPVMIDCEGGRLTLPEARRLARDLRKALKLAGVAP